MATNRDGGKGDRPRPIPNWDHYATNWDKIFQKTKEQQKERAEKPEPLHKQIQGSTTRRETLGNPYFTHIHTKEIS